MTTIPATKQRVRKAVLTVAGSGTRMLPVTKSVPKELLPLVDVPTIQLIVEECVASGIEEIIFVTSRGKDAIVDHFDRALDLEAILDKKGKTGEADAIRRLATMANFSAVRQPAALGLGHAVLCARAAVGNEPFAVLLGDDLVDAKRPALRQLLDVYDEYQQGVIALLEVPPGQEHLYGVVKGERIAPRVHRLAELVEKPAPGTAPSRLAVIGRYVLPPEIFSILEHTPTGRGGEIQLTDALARLATDAGLLGCEFEGERFDAGDRAGYVLAVVHWALKRGDIGAAVRAGLEQVLRIR